MGIIDLIDRGELKVIVKPGNPNFTYQNARSYEPELLSLARIGGRQQWISISEKLPDKETSPVDIWLKHYGIRETNYFFLTKPKVFLNLTNKYPTQLSEVSHWRYSENDKPEWGD